MYKSFLSICLIAASFPVARADFRYDQSSKITGGAILGMMKFAGRFSKDARKAGEPILSTTAVKGNRMVHKTADSVQIVDLDQETITSVNLANRTYSVMTFAQMKQAMDDMSKKMQRQSRNGPPPDVQYDVSLKETGQTRTIAGTNAREVIMTISVKGADAQSGQTGALDVKTDMWLAPHVAGYQEMRDFHRRMGAKLAWTPDAPMGMARPDLAKAMAEMGKEGAKLDGMPVYEVIGMGGSAEGIPTSTDSRPSSPPPASVSDAVGGAIAGRLGIGGFGRKKPKQEAPPQSQDASQTGTVSGSLMEMTVEVTSYSASPADAALFEVPAGFTRVEEDPMRPGSRRAR